MKSLEALKPLALLILRMALGAIFIYHGYPKLFTQARDSMQTFVHLGFPGYMSYLIGVIELFGGAMLIIGLFTRIAGLLLAGEMAVALIKVHGILANPGAMKNYEFPLSMAAGSFALAVLGAGVISFDHAIFRESSGGRKSSRSRPSKEKD